MEHRAKYHEKPYQKRGIMVFLIVLLIIILLAGVFLISPLPVILFFHMDNETTWLKASVLAPFIKLRGELKNNRPVISAYLLNIRVWRKALGHTNEKGRALDWLRAADVSDIQVDARYSLRDPFMTGLVSGVAGAVLSFVQVDKLSYSPDFTALHSYVHVEASAQLRIGNTLLNFADNNKKSRRQEEWSKA